MATPGCPSSVLEESFDPQHPIKSDRPKDPYANLPQSSQNEPQLVVKTEVQGQLLSSISEPEGSRCLGQCSRSLEKDVKPSLEEIQIEPQLLVKTEVQGQLLSLEDEVSEPEDNSCLGQCSQSLENDVKPSLEEIQRYGAEESHLKCDTTINTQVQPIHVQMVVEPTIIKPNQQLINSMEQKESESSGSKSPARTKLTDDKMIQAFIENNRISCKGRLQLYMQKAVVQLKCVRYARGYLKKIICENEVASGTKNVIIRKSNVSTHQILEKGNPLEGIALSQTCFISEQAIKSKRIENDSCISLVTSHNSNSTHYKQTPAGGAVCLDGCTQTRTRKDIVCRFMNKFRKATHPAVGGGKHCKTSTLMKMKFLNSVGDHSTRLAVDMARARTLPSNRYELLGVKSELVMPSEMFDNPSNEIDLLPMTTNVSHSSHGAVISGPEEPTDELNQCPDATKDTDQQPVSKKNDPSTAGSFTCEKPTLSSNSIIRLNCDPIELTKKSIHGTAVTNKENVGDNCLFCVRGASREVAANNGERSDTKSERRIQNTDHRDNPAASLPRDCAEITINGKISMHIYPYKDANGTLTSDAFGSEAHQEKEVRIDQRLSGRTRSYVKNYAEYQDDNDGETRTDDSSDNWGELVGRRRQRKRSASSRKAKTIKKPRKGSPRQPSLGKDSNSHIHRETNFDSVNRSASPIGGESSGKKDGRKSTGCFLQQKSEVNNIKPSKAKKQQISPSKSLAMSKSAAGKNASVRQTLSFQSSSFQPLRTKPAATESGDDSMSRSANLMPNVNTSSEPCKMIMKNKRSVVVLPCILKIAAEDAGQTNSVYQCLICPYTEKCLTGTVDHTQGEHAKEVHLAICSGSEQKSLLYVGCRHCDFVALNKLTLWNHFATYHNVSGNALQMSSSSD